MANRNWWVTHDPYWWRGTGNSGPGAPDEPQQQTFGSPIGGGLWPTFLPTGDLGASQTSWSSVLPSANLSPASEHESPVAQTLRQLSPNWPQADRGSLGLMTPNEPPLQTLLGAYIGNAFGRHLPRARILGLGKRLRRRCCPKRISQPYP